MKSTVIVAVSAFTLFQPETEMTRNIDDATDIYFDEQQLREGLIEMDPRAIEYLGDEGLKSENATRSSRLYLLAKLHSLFSDWEMETKFSSSIEEKVSNANFQKIIKYGRDMIPAILEEINSNPSELVWALNYITGRRISERPISVVDACKSWVNWGKVTRLI